MEYPIFCLLGERGSGKSTTATLFAMLYSQDPNIHVYADYTMYNVKYTKIRFSDIQKTPDKFHDGVIILDEVHVGTDAYKFFSSRVVSITDFITQLRKRRLTLIIITQRFNTIAKRMRDQVNYIIECHATDVKGVVQIKVFDRAREYGDDFVKEFILDGRSAFPHFDTNEIIKDE